MGLLSTLRISKFTAWVVSGLPDHVARSELDTMNPSTEKRAFRVKIIPKGTLPLTAVFLLVSTFHFHVHSLVQSRSLETHADKFGPFELAKWPGHFSAASGQCFGQDFLKPYVLGGNSPTPTPSNRHSSTPLNAEKKTNLNQQRIFANYSQAKSLREDSTLRAVAFGTQSNGIACGDRGVILRTEDGGLSWNLIDSIHESTLTDITWINPQRAVIVGGSVDRVTGISRGVVLWTQDGGLTWSDADDMELPMLSKVTLVGQKLQASGHWSDSLLTHHFESNDNGISWQASNSPRTPMDDSELSRADQLRWRVATNRILTVRDACRTSQDGICLVGDHGVIALTNDRGQTWKMVRGENRKSGVLFVSRNPATVAWSLVGSEALEERHRVNLICENLRGPTGQSSSNDEVLQAARQAAIGCGAASLDEIQFSKEQDTSTIIKQWIAIHEPAVVVLDGSLQEAIKDSFLSIGISRNVKRVIEYSFCDPEQRASQGNLMHQHALLSRTGILASDLHADSMHWIDPNQAIGRSIKVVTLYDVASAASRGESLMNGLSIKGGENLSAKMPEVSRRKLQIARARIKNDTQLEQLVTKSASTDQFKQLLLHLIESKSKDDQFRLVWQTIRKTKANIDDHPSLERYEIALQTCIDRFPHLTVSHWAQLKLDSIRNSVEWQKLRTLLPQRAKRSQLQFGITDPVLSPFQMIDDGVQQASAISPALPSVSRVVVPRMDNTAAESTQSSSRKLELDLRWEFHPLVLLSRDAARQRNDSGELQIAANSSPNLQRLTQSSTAWSDFLKSNGKQTLTALEAISPPRLDGKLDESCWQRPLTQKDGTSIRLSHDEEYVYLGITLPADRLNPESSASDATATLRDQPLHEFDRLKICIDTDRDLLSSMELQVTASGKVFDSIDGCKHWQPTWYPAIQTTTDTQTFEIAILRRDLTDLPIASDERWFLAIRSIEADQKQSSSFLPAPEKWLQVKFE